MKSPKKENNFHSTIKRHRDFLNNISPCENSPNRKRFKSEFQRPLSNSMDFPSIVNEF